MTGRLRLDTAIFGNQPVPELVRQVRLAESLGYDGVWVIDSQLICRELYVTLTACALATERIRIGAGVTVPGTRHAAVTASATASLAELAPGRVVLGVGTGFSSVGTLGLAPARVAEVERLIATCRGLLAAGTVPLPTGIDARITWLERPLGIPIYVGASGPRMLDLAGRAADGVLLHCGTVPDMIQGGLDRVAAGAAGAGRDPAAVEVAVWAPTSIGPDRTLARDHVRGRVASALRQAMPVALTDEERRAVETLRREYDHFAHASADAHHRALVPDRLIDLFALAGTPAEVAGRVGAIAALPGVARLVMVPQVPGDGFRQREDILREFADTVVKDATRRTP
jgi:5,10-methylenetetrahydromethanopterin reductase